MALPFDFAERLWKITPLKPGIKPSFSFTDRSIFVKTYRMLSPETIEFYRKVGSVFGQGPFWVAQRLFLEIYIYCVAYTNVVDGSLSWDKFDFAFPHEVREEMGDPVYLGSGGT